MSEFVRCYAGVAHDSPLSARAEGAAAMIRNHHHLVNFELLEYHVAAALPNKSPAAQIQHGRHLLGSQGFHTDTSMTRDPAGRFAHSSSDTSR